jgi:hypothetical protein
MKNEFIPYEEALALKELGYKEDYENGLKHYGMYCEGEFYRLYPNMGNDIPDDVYREVDAPLWQQAFRWFREKYDLWYQIYRDGYAEHNIVFQIWSNKGIKSFKYESKKTSYEEAELACLRKLIEIIKPK